jgi:signal recognition particle receptor subunit beta
MQSLRIVIAGPFDAGKTTFIKAISEITVLSTERQVSDPSGHSGAETTVAMDFGRVTVSDDVVLYLFGTPGHERFSFMWDALSEGMLGFVVLFDGSSQSSVSETRSMLEYFSGMLDAHFVVAANRVKPEDTDKLEQLRRDLELDDSVPLIAVDSRDRESAKAVIVRLLEDILSHLA